MKGTTRLCAPNTTVVLALAVAPWATGCLFSSDLGGRRDAAADAGGDGETPALDASDDRPPEVTAGDDAYTDDAGQDFGDDADGDVPTGVDADDGGSAEGADGGEAGAGTASDAAATSDVGSDAAPTLWIDRTPCPAPKMPFSWSSSRVAVAYDRAGRLLWLGGPSGLTDLFARDSATFLWSSATPCGTTFPPTPLLSGEMAYDDARGRLWVLGQRTAGGALLMSLDGTTWSDHSGDFDSASPRPGGATLYDSVGDRLVVMADDSSTWTRDGSTGKFTAIRPASGLMSARPAWDRARSQVLVIGWPAAGASPSFPGNALWALDLAGTWTPLPPSGATAPWPSLGGSDFYPLGIAYDEDRDRLVVFGSNPSSVNELWELDPAARTWTKRSAPPDGWGGYYQQLVYDRVAKRMLMISGTKIDTWHGATDTFTIGNAATQTATPALSERLTVAYDSSRARLTFFGSSSGTNSVFEWDAATGSFSNRTPAAGMPPDLGQAVFDQGLGQIVLVASWQMLVWDGSARTLTDITPSPLPASWPPMVEATPVYDEGRRRTVVFDGRLIWEWNSSNGLWAKRTPASGVPPTWTGDGEIVHDPVRGRTLLYRYQAGAPPISDLLAWDGAAGTWIDLTPTPLPSAWPKARHKPRLTYDRTRDRILLFGGQDDVQVIRDTWEYDPAAGTWTNYTPLPLPVSWPARSIYSALAYDGGRKASLLYGASGYSPDLNYEFWEWSPP